MQRQNAFVCPKGAYIYPDSDGNWYCFTRFELRNFILTDRVNIYTGKTIPSYELQKMREWLNKNKRVVIDLDKNIVKEISPRNKGRIVRKR